MLQSPVRQLLQPVLQMGRAQLISAQRIDPSLACCIESVANFKNKLPDKVTYYWEGDVLMHRWRPMLVPPLKKSTK